MIYQPNFKTLYGACSEAIYRLNLNIIKKFSEKEELIFKRIIDSITCAFPGTSEKLNLWEYKPYFENTELDLFLDYFEIPSERNHWTGSATSEINKKKYSKLMKEFCEKHNLPFKDIYKRRYKDEE